MYLNYVNIRYTLQYVSPSAGGLVKFLLTMSMVMQRSSWLKLVFLCSLQPHSLVSAISITMMLASARQWPCSGKYKYNLLTLNDLLLFRYLNRYMPSALQKTTYGLFTSVTCLIYNICNDISQRQFSC